MEGVKEEGEDIGKRDGLSFCRANIISLIHIWPCWILLEETTSQNRLVNMTGYIQAWWFIELMLQMDQEVKV